MKMALWPVIDWWLIYYIIKRKAHNLNTRAWLTNAMAAVIVGLINMTKHGNKHHMITDCYLKPYYLTLFFNAKHSQK
jgi:hypothetical protein